jgi:hypothetical protein
MPNGHKVEFVLIDDEIDTTYENPDTYDIEVEADGFITLTNHKPTNNPTGATDGK